MDSKHLPKQLQPAEEIKKSKSFEQKVSLNPKSDFIPSNPSISLSTDSADEELADFGYTYFLEASPKSINKPHDLSFGLEDSDDDYDDFKPSPFPLVQSKDQKTSPKKAPPLRNLDVYVCEKLARLTEAAYQEAQKELGDSKTSPADIQSSLLKVNFRQAKKYGLYEFTFKTVSQPEAEVLFKTAFGDNHPEILLDLRNLLPDNVKLLFTSKKTLSTPRYEFEGRLILLSTYLSAKLYLYENNKLLPSNIITEISKALDKDWKFYNLAMVDLYKLPLKNKTDHKTHMDELSEIVNKFQTSIWGYLVPLKASPDLTDEKFYKNFPQYYKEIATEVFGYEQKPKVDIYLKIAGLSKPADQKAEEEKFRELERELNCDVFRLNADGHFQYYNRHFPTTTQQESKSFFHQYADPHRTLFPTGTAHGDGWSLPNFAMVYEGSYRDGKLELRGTNFRHGTPLCLQEGKKEKHINTYQAFLNFELELQIVRAQSIEAVLLEYNDDLFPDEPQHSLSFIKQISLTVSKLITDHLHKKLLLNSNFNIYKEIPTIMRAIEKEPLLERDPGIALTLGGCIEFIVSAKHFYTHIISSHDKFWERPQFSACRLAQFALDETRESAGFVYLCAPVNIPQIIKASLNVSVGGFNLKSHNKIPDMIRSALIEMYLSFKTVFPDDPLVYSLKKLDFSRYHQQRSALSTAVRKYFQAYESTPNRTGLLDTLRKECKTAEDQLFHATVLNSVFDQLKQTILSNIPKTTAGIILKAMVTMFCDGRWTQLKGHYNGLLPTLTHVFCFCLDTQRRLELIENSSIRISSSGGCKNGQNRWQRIALMLTQISALGFHPLCLENQSSTSDDQFPKSVEDLFNKLEQSLNVHGEPPASIPWEWTHQSNCPNLNFELKDPRTSINQQRKKIVPKIKKTDLKPLSNQSLSVETKIIERSQATMPEVPTQDSFSLSSTFQKSSLLTALPQEMPNMEAKINDQKMVLQDKLFPFELKSQDKIPVNFEEKCKSDILSLGVTIPWKELKITESPLGEGAYGIVYKGAWNRGDLNKEEPVAVKKIKLQYINEDSLADLLKEAKIMLQLGIKSPYIVGLKGICMESPHYSLVMELMVKGSLYHLLHSKQELSWEIRFRIALDIIYGLIALHENEPVILHLDLKSLNILLNDKLRAKISDFGFSKFKEDSTLKTCEEKGTAAWMAPELFDPKVKRTKAVDVYSFGMVLWEIVTRARPFKDAHNQAQVIGWVTNKKQEEIPSSCPRILESIIKSCWEFTPEKRPTTLEVADKLNSLMTGEEQKLSLITSTQTQQLVPGLQKFKEKDDETKFIPMTQTAVSLHVPTIVSQNPQGFLPAPKAIPTILNQVNPKEAVLKI